MEISKLSFRKETKEAMDKPMSVRAKGKVLFARLEELDKDGTLSKAQSRADVARLVGYPKERAKAGYAWVSNLIRRGHITETIRGYSPSGVADCEYHLTGTNPDYGYEERGRRKQRKEAIAKVAREAVRQGLAEPMPVLDDLATRTSIAATKVEISKGDIIIKLELCDTDTLVGLVKQLLKGE